MKRKQKQKHRKVDAFARAAMRRLGRNVKGAREFRNMTVRDLEARSGVSIGSISAIENGNRDTSTTKLLKLAKGLDVLPSVLLHK